MFRFILRDIQVGQNNLTIILMFIAVYPVIIT